MTQQQADADGWRGTVQGTLMHQKDGTGLDMRYGGFMDGLSTSFASKYYFLQAMGYYWTATPGDDLEEHGLHPQTDVQPAGCLSPHGFSERHDERTFRP